jgi:hypothetical protein
LRRHCSAPPLFFVHLADGQAGLRRYHFDEHMVEDSRQLQGVQSLPNSDAFLGPDAPPR